MKEQNLAPYHREYEYSKVVKPKMDKLAPDMKKLSKISIYMTHGYKKCANIWGNWHRDMAQLRVPTP